MAQTKLRKEQQEALEGTDILSTGEAGGTKFLREDGDGTCSWQTPPGGGTVDTSGTPVANDFARFTDADTIEGRSYAEVRADLSLEPGTDVQSVLAEGVFVDGDKTKLDGIEAGADVTDAANVEDAITGQAADTLTDASVIPFVKSATLAKITWANFKAAIKTYYDSVTATLTNKTLGSGTVLDGEMLIDATPDTDHEAHGPTTNTINAGATIAQSELCYLASDGEWALADADATATTDKFLSLALEAGTDGNPMKVALPGSFVRDDTWNWTVGGAIYAGTTAGALTQTAPSGTDDVVRVVGYAVSADVMWFSPETGVVHA